MRVLISGAGGFVGRRLTVTMARNQYNIIALVRRSRWPAMLDRPRVQIECADLGHAANLPAGPFDAIIHCAAAIPARVPNEAELFRINTEGARVICSSTRCMWALA